MSVPTYQQILAQQYEESARDLLVQQQESNEIEEIDAHNSSNQVGTTLENPEAFQEFGGNRGNGDHIIVPKTYVDNGKTSILYNKDVQIDIFSIDSRFRAYAVPGVPTKTSSLNNYIGVLAQQIATQESLSQLTSLTSNFVFRIQKATRNIISSKLTSFELPNTFYNIQDVRYNNYIYVASGTCSSNPTYTPVSVHMIDISLQPGCPTTVHGSGVINGYYYSNTSIISALNTALNSAFSDLSVTSSNGYCQINNSSQTTYTISFQPFFASLSTYQLFPTLGSMLGFNQINYDILPSSSTLPPPSFECAQISACQCYGSLIGEDLIDMNADPYIYISISDWANLEHATVNDTYFTAFARIPINVSKGQKVYDNSTNNTSTKTYNFLQPTNIQQFEIKLLDMTGKLLIMPNTNWSMVLEMEEVLSQSLYEKLREI